MGNERHFVRNDLQCLVFLQRLSRWRTLKVGTTNCRLVLARLLSVIGQHKPGVTDLTIAASGIHSYELGHIVRKAFPGLQRLRLAGRGGRMRSGFLAEIGSMQDKVPIEHFDFSSLDLLRPVLVGISELPCLTSLKLMPSSFADGDALAPLSRATNLVSLQLSTRSRWLRAGDVPDLDPLTALTNLTRLELDQVARPNHGFQAPAMLDLASALPALQQLALTSLSVGPATLAALGDLPNLRDLTVYAFLLTCLPPDAAGQAPPALHRLRRVAVACDDVLQRRFASRLVSPDTRVEVTPL